MEYGCKLLDQEMWIHLQNCLKNSYEWIMNMALRIETVFKILKYMKREIIQRFPLIYRTCLKGGIGKCIDYLPKYNSVQYKTKSLLKSHVIKYKILRNSDIMIWSSWLFLDLRSKLNLSLFYVVIFTE